MRFMAQALLALPLAAALAQGCASSYAWRPSVPPEMRTVSVPVFRSEADVAGIGSAMSRQILREFQREGTFSVRRPGDAALEVQGVVRRVRSGSTAYSRRAAHRMNAYEMTAEVDVSVIDVRAGRVLVDNRPYRARATFTAGQDIDTAQRDASGRLAEVLARQVVDDVAGLRLHPAKPKKGDAPEK